MNHELRGVPQYQNSIPYFQSVERNWHIYLCWVPPIPDTPLLRNYLNFAAKFEMSRLCVLSLHNNWSLSNSPLGFRFMNKILLNHPDQFQQSWSPTTNCSFMDDLWAQIIQKFASHIQWISHMWGDNKCCGTITVQFLFTNPCPSVEL